MPLACPTLGFAPWVDELHAGVALSSVSPLPRTCHVLKVVLCFLPALSASRASWPGGALQMWVHHLLKEAELWQDLQALLPAC